MSTAADPAGGGGGDGDQTLERAEAWLDGAVQGVTRFAVRLAARAREEAEDFWAEAEAVRRSAPPSDDRA
jgi:hypothetical protein